jgi:hypothetical protein
MTQRLPTPGGDDGDWGNILNSFLEVSLTADGTLNSNTVGTAQIQNNAVTNTQLDSATQTTLASVADKYTKPGSGIPASDLTSAVQTSLTSASNAVQLGGDISGTTTSPLVETVKGGSIPLIAPNNLSDLASVDTARGNIHIPELATAQAVAAANVSTMSGLPSNTVTDGATLAVGDIVLLIAQNTQSQNGPWVIASGSWTRPLDFPSGLVFRNRNIMVSQGSNYGGNVFQCLSESQKTVGTSSLSWALGSGGNPTASDVSVNDSQFQILQGTDTDLQTTLNDVDGLLSTTSATSSNNSSSISTLQSLVASSIQRVFQNSDNTWPSPTGPTQWIALGTYKGVWTTATAYQLNDIVTNSGSMYTASTAFTSGASFSADSGKWNQVPIQNGDQIISK